MTVQTVGERIKEIRDDQHLNLEKFGQRIGVSKSTMSNIENNNRNATDHMIKSICREFGYNEEWLRTGEGSRKTDIDIDEEYGKICANLGITDERAKKVIINYAHMSPEGKRKFWDFVDTLLKE